MKTRLLKLVGSLRASYWFLPSLMALIAIGLSFAFTAADAAIGADWLNEVGWLYANKPEGARALLSTIAGSMIGVAGVTFSITIASVVYASGQYGPRLLTVFMRDRGNQVTLGTFIATFLYCLLVLRTIRSADEAVGTAAEPVVGAFVPHLAILFGVVLALASLGVLIFFIHHIPESIHVSNVIAGVGRDLQRRLDALLPEQIGAPGETPFDPATALPEGFFETAAAVPAQASGYVQYADEEGLLHLARKHDVILRVACRPGDFLSPGKALALVWPPEQAEAVADALRLTFAWGRQRTPAQDVRFLVNELVEIAARALSPGLNDPFTAISCIDWLQAGLIAMARHNPPSPARYDAEGHLRVLVRPTTFEEMADAVFDQLRPYARVDFNAALHLMGMIGNAGEEVHRATYRARLRLHAEALHEECQAVLGQARERALLAERYEQTVRQLYGEAAARVLAGDAT